MKLDENEAMLFYAPRWLWRYWEGMKVEMSVPNELRYSVTDSRMPGFAKPLGVASDDMVADKVSCLSCSTTGWQLWFVTWLG